MGSVMSGQHRPKKIVPTPSLSINYEKMSISSILTGKNIAVNEEATINASPLVHSEGSFDILPTDKTGRDFRGKGRLEYSKNDTFSSRVRMRISGSD